MSVHDVGRYGYDRQHTGFKSLAIRGYRAGCILDWLESVAGWGKQEYRHSYTSAYFYPKVYIQVKNWHTIAKNWQSTQQSKGNTDVTCRVGKCDGVKEKTA